MGYREYQFVVTNEVFRQWFPRWQKRHGWKPLPNRFTSDKKRKSVFTVTHTLFYFLHAILQTNPPKTITNRSFRHCRQGYLSQHCDVTAFDLRRHANASYWYRDVISMDLSCTRKLAQRRYSLVKNNREYRYPATRFHRLSCKKRSVYTFYLNKCHSYVCFNRSRFS